jgi:SAM-dependent methyltransferase
MPKHERVKAILQESSQGQVAARQHYMSTESGSTGGIQAMVQRFPGLYALIKLYLMPTWSFKGWRAFTPDPGSHTVLNLGAGTTDLHPEMINVDFVKFPHIDIVADFSRNLPIRSGTIDAVVCQSVLEHLENPKTAVAEVERILKPGGLVYITTPFQYPFHGAPLDYYRWTLRGLQALLGPSFEVTASGNRGGAMGVIILSLGHALGQVCSFGSGTLYALVNFGVMGILAPLKLIDLLLGFLPFNTVLCPSLYIVARKK